MATGATIHTANGMLMRITRRNAPPSDGRQAPAVGQREPVAA